MYAPDDNLSLDEEKHYALKYPKNLCPNTGGRRLLCRNFYRTFVESNTNIIM